MAELEAIVADYLEQAALWDAIPAAGAVLPAGRAARSASDERPHDPDRAGARAS